MKAAARIRLEPDEGEILTLPFFLQILVFRPRRRLFFEEQ
jgi:hypothetical protein